MSILADRDMLVNESLDQGCPTNCPRRYEQLRRVLGLIDLLAAAVRHQTTHEIQHAYNELHGETWHWRTFERDLLFLEESGLVDMDQRQDFGDRRTSTRVWKLNLSRSENAQEVAIALLDDEETEVFLPSGERDSFNVLIRDCETGDCWQVWQDLPFDEVTNRMELWRYNVTNCVLIPWHSDLPVPEGIINCDPSERLADNHAAQELLCV